MKRSLALTSIVFMIGIALNLFFAPYIHGQNATPVPPPVLKVESVQLANADQVLQITVRVSDPSRVNIIDSTIVNEATGMAIRTQTGFVSGSIAVLEFSTAELDVAAEYKITLTPKDGAGATFLSDRNEIIFTEYEFTYQPSAPLQPVLLAIESILVDVAREVVTVTLYTENAASVQSVSGYYINSMGTQAGTFENIPFSSASPELIVPLPVETIDSSADIESVTYNLVLIPADLAGQRVDLPNGPLQQEFSFEPSREITFGQRFARLGWVMWLAIIITIVLVTLVFRMLYRRSRLRKEKNDLLFDPSLPPHDDAKQATSAPAKRPAEALAPPTYLGGQAKPPNRSGHRATMPQASSSVRQSINKQQASAKKSTGHNKSAKRSPSRREKDEEFYAVITILKYPDQSLVGKKLTIREFPFVLGRAQFPDDSKVSTQHLELSRGRLRPTIKDLGSTNGTYLNGRVVRKKEPSSLDFDETVTIQLGPRTRVQLTFLRN